MYRSWPSGSNSLDHVPYRACSPAGARGLSASRRLAEFLQDIHARTSHIRIVLGLRIRYYYAFQRCIEGVYLPFCRRSWKESTAGTSEQIIKTHLVPLVGKTLLHAIPQEELQDFLDRKAPDLSSS